MHVIATAGHVDHGKSTLVRALTGMEPDRWAEERRRGMTIDLGYAWTELAGAGTVAFVDVPGHSRFIRNMLAGVGPVPAVLLVVAADDGWGRQTGEHLAALDALGVRDGVLAITRSDLADPRTAEQEARTYLAGTSLEGIEAVAVSPVGGRGLDELRAALARMITALPPPAAGPARLWVDRVFSVRGAGTVVTGTLATGTITAGDALIDSGSGRVVRVRALQSLDEAVPSVSAVARVAVNLRDVRTQQLGRGCALITPERWVSAHIVDVRLTRAPADRPPSQVIVHLGSAAVPARLRPLGADTARLGLAAPLPMHVGDRMILRDPGAQAVIAGAVALDLDPPAFTRRGAATRRCGELTALTGAPDPAAEIARRGAVRWDWLVSAGILGGDAPLPVESRAHGAWVVAEPHFRRWQESLDETVTRWAREHPLSPGMARSALVTRLDLPEDTLLEPLVRASAGLVLDAAGVHRRDARASLPPAVEATLAALCGTLAQHPFAAPEAGDLATAGLDPQHLSVAVRDGRLLRVAPQVYLLPDAPDEAVNRLSALPQPFTLSQAREALGTTRRVAVPLLELLDQRRVTERIDASLRVLRPAVISQV